jgi:WD40 repeat protein
MDRLGLLAVDGPGSDVDDPIVLMMKDIPHTSSSNGDSSALSDPPTPPMPLRPFSDMSLEIGRHKNVVESECFSPDGSKIVSGSPDQTICIWDITDWETSVSSVQWAHKLCLVGRLFARWAANRLWVRGHDYQDLGYTAWKSTSWSN